VFCAGIAIGALVPRTGRGLLALVQATAFTAVGMLATIRPHEVDGQTALGIPMMWFPFLVVSYVGLIIGAALRWKASSPPKS
jgi:hypothetical protein